MDLHDLGTAQQRSESCLGGIRGELDHHCVDNREDVQEGTATLRHNLRLHRHRCSALENDDTAQALAPRPGFSQYEAQSKQAKKEEPMSGLALPPVGVGRDILCTLARGMIVGTSSI